MDDHPQPESDQLDLFEQTKLEQIDRDYDESIQKRAERAVEDKLKKTGNPF